MLGIHHSIFFVSIPLPLHPTIILPPKEQVTSPSSSFLVSASSQHHYLHLVILLAVVVVIVAVYVVAAAIEIASRLHEQIRGTLFVIEGSQRLIAGKGEGEGDKICDDSFRVLAGL